MGDRLLFGRFLPLLLLLPILLVSVVVVSRFDGVYGQDSFAYYNYAVGPLQDSLRNFKPLPPFFWPPGYPLLVSLASIILGATPLAGQLVSAMGGMAVVALTVLFARQVWPHDRWVPLLAGLLVTLMGQLWESSAVVMSDATALAAATFGMYWVVRYGREATLSHLALATIGISYASLCRWAYPLVAIPSTVYTLLVIATLPRNQAGRHIVLAGAIVSIVMSPVLYAIWQQIQFESTGGIAFIGNFGVYSWNPMAAFNRIHSTDDGTLTYTLPNGLYYALSPAHPLYFTPLLALFGLPGLWHVWQRRTRELFWLVLVWIGLVMLFHAGNPHQNFRFTLVYLPPTAVIVAIGVVAVGQGLSTRFRFIFGLVVATGFIWMTIVGTVNLQQFIARHMADRATAQWADDQLPTDATIIAFGITLTLQHVSQLDVRESFYLDEVKLAQMVAEIDNLYLILDVERLLSQWEGHPPDENYRWLRDEIGLELIGRHNGYTFFQVKEAGP